MEGLCFVDTPGILAGSSRLDRGYDHDSVMMWFAERADRILVLSDAHKLDLSAQFTKVKQPAAEEVRKRKREELSEATAIPGEPVEFDELFRPVTETVGVNLLKGMGWRQGQVIYTSLERS